MSHIENIRAGDFIAVTKDREAGEAATQEFQSPFGIVTCCQPKPDIYNGNPLEVQAVSAPFLCVSDGKGVFSLDTRRFDVTKLNRAYVKAMRLQKAIGPGIQRLLDNKNRKQVAIAAEAEVAERFNVCPQCGGKLKKVKIYGTYGNSPGSRLECTRCDFHHPVPVAT